MANEHITPLADELVGIWNCTFAVAAAVLIKHEKDGGSAKEFVDAARQNEEKYR